MRMVDLIIHDSFEFKDVPKWIQEQLGIDGEIHFANDIEIALDLANKSTRDVLLAIEEYIDHYDLKYFFDHADGKASRAMIYAENDGQKLYFPSVGEKVLPREFQDGFALKHLFFFSSQVRPFTTAINNLIPVVKSEKSFKNIRKRPTLFLDRDGVINKDVSYLHKIEDLEIFDEIIPIIKRANKKDINVVVLTNQAGVARGMFSEKDVKKVNSEIIKRLKEKDAYIKEFFNCYYIESGKVPKYKKQSLLRKPMPGLLLLACSKYPVEIDRSFLIGDKMSDRLLMPGFNYLTIKRNYEVEEGDNTYKNLKDIYNRLLDELF